MTQDKAIVNVARDFSAMPVGRYTDDGDHSGQIFRERVLLPLLEKHIRVIVDLEGLIGVGSSFLEEAFGGLVRENCFTAEQLRSLLKILPEDDDYCQEIWEYIDEAQQRKSQSNA
jgi:hypothetical protein